MVKTIFKEIFIMLLLCIAIVLILGILFYDYIPTNRVIPTKEAYITPENVRQEIDEQITEIEKTEVSYEITDSDLNIYKQTSSYQPGKRDPFSLVTESAENTADNNTQKDTSEEEEENNNDSTSSDTEVNANSTNTFFDDEITK